MSLSYDPDQAARWLSSCDACLGHLIQRVGPCQLRLLESRCPFQALVYSVIFQQISKKAARAIQANVWGLFGGAPEPRDIIKADEEQLCAAGLSRNKVATIRGLAHSSLEGTLPDRRQLADMGDAAVVDSLIAHRGIGPWTAHMLLIFHLGRPDVRPVYGEDTAWRTL